MFGSSTSRGRVAVGRPRRYFDLPLSSLPQSFAFYYHFRPHRRRCPLSQTAGTQKTQHTTPTMHKNQNNTRPGAERFLHFRFWLGFRLCPFAFSVARLFTSISDDRCFSSSSSAGEQIEHSHGRLSEREWKFGRGMSSGVSCSPLPDLGVGLHVLGACVGAGEVLA
jgi:hypothetical protein